MSDDGNSSTEGENTQPSAGESQQQEPGTPSDGQPKSTQDGGKAEKPDYQKLYEETLAHARKWESRAKENHDKAKKWDKAEEANRTETEKLSKRAEEAETRAQRAITAAVAAEVRAAASDWETPADAPRYLDDLSTFIGEDGEIDRKAIGKAVAEVLKQRPYLAKTQRRGPAPDPGQGARGDVSLADRITEAERKGDVREAMRLKAEQMLSQR